MGYNYIPYLKLVLTKEQEELAEPNQVFAIDYLEKSFLMNN